MTDTSRSNGTRAGGVGQLQQLPASKTLWNPTIPVTYSRCGIKVSQSVSLQTSRTNPGTRVEQMYDSIHFGPQLAFLYISIVVICTFHFVGLLFSFFRLDRETEKYGEGREVARKKDRESTQTVNESLPGGQTQGGKYKPIHTCYKNISIFVFC